MIGYFPQAGASDKIFFALVLGATTLFGGYDLAFAQAKKENAKGAGMTCAQQCQQFCQNKHVNCFDKCSGIKCNR